MNGKIARIIDELIDNSQIKQIEGLSDRRKKKQLWKTLNWKEKTKVRKNHAKLSK
jgi:hypothetical protein